MRKLNEKELAKALADTANNMSFDKKQFAGEIMRQHRTLQQQIFQTFLVCIEEWSKQDSFDPRNQATVMKSMEIMELIKDTHVPYI